jgi:hypothetical protein
LRHHEIGHDPCSAGRFKNRVGMGAPKVPHRFPLIVQYPMLLTMGPDPHWFALQGRRPVEDKKRGSSAWAPALVIMT